MSKSKAEWAKEFKRLFPKLSKANVFETEWDNRENPFSFMYGKSVRKNRKKQKSKGWKK